MRRARWKGVLAIVVVVASGGSGVDIALRKRRIVDICRCANKCFAFFA